MPRPCSRAKSQRAVVDRDRAEERYRATGADADVEHPHGAEPWAQLGEDRLLGTLEHDLARVLMRDGARVVEPAMRIGREHALLASLDDRRGVPRDVRNLRCSSVCSSVARTARCGPPRRARVPAALMVPRGAHAP